jgi:DNA uptake protein ComE-like DNA-binding protein
VLVAAIWVLVFFSVLTVALHSVASSQMTLARRLRGQGISYWLARAAAEYAQAEQSLDPTPYDGLFELRKMRDNQFDQSHYQYFIVDEESKLNVNTASGEMLARLPGMDEESAKLVIQSPLRPFVAVEQLLAVEGIEKEKYEQFEEFITVFGAGKVNINTASGPVLFALGMDMALVESIIQFRAGADGVEGTEDDFCFERTQEILEQLRGRSMLFAAQETALLQLVSRGFLGVSAEVLTLHVAASVVGGAPDKYQITINARGITQWREI